MERLGEVLYWVFHMPCLFHFLTGLYCPGCGGTRAVRYLLAGDIWSSIQYHPLVIYTVIIVTLEIISAIIRKTTHNPKWYLGHEKEFIYIGGGIILLNWIWKNYMLLVWGIDLLSTGI